MSPIHLIRTPDDLRVWRRGLARDGARVALAPTMGALHAGHLSLVGIARRHAEVAVASVFVNPTQFAPHEDFAAYPRDEDRDFALLAEAGCHAVYAPRIEDIYPDGFDTRVLVGDLAAPLEGACRPGHFAGVATVVAKLLIQAWPDVAVFGEKDYQQWLVIRRMALDLGLPVEIIGAPIVREADGLALSSRNVYLSAAERDLSPRLHATLLWAAEMLAGGADVEATEQQVRRRLTAAGFSLDYLEVRDPESLARFAPGPLVGEGRILVAARLGRTRLIDNLSVTRRQSRANA